MRNIVEATKHNVLNGRKTPMLRDLHSVSIKQDCDIRQKYVTYLDTLLQPQPGESSILYFWNTCLVHWEFTKKL